MTSTALTEPARRAYNRPRLSVARPEARMPAEFDNLLSLDDLLDTGRMREQLEIARRIQRAFLPTAPPGLQAFDIAGWNEPCYEAGGDYYDFLRLPGGRLGLAIGDVSSHGIGPALLMASARSALRALFQVGDGPGDVLSRLNDVLVADMLEDHFMTMFVGVLDLRTKRLRYAVAGHERPLLLRHAAEEFVRLSAPGIPLGIAPGFRYAEGQELVLRQGDLLACLTDGVWEAVDGADEEFGYDRFEVVLRQHRSATAGGVIDAVRSAVAEFVGDTRQSDDITLMVLRAL
jgi:sigma-B regulation protein RsbU (phosphoserine phosphatase)